MTAVARQPRQIDYVELKGRITGAGLLERQVSDDRRVKGVRLTSAGLDLRSRLEARLIADHPAVRGLTLAEQDTMLNLLRRLTDFA